MKKLLLLLVLMLLPMMASADISGTCGKNLAWTLIESTNTLTITGSGTMDNFDHLTPWIEHRSKIKIIEIGDEVTSIGNYAFSNCYEMTSITIGKNVSSIGEYAFYKCSALTYIKIPNNVTSIGNNAFQNCFELSSISMGNGLTSIGNFAFINCSGLTSVSIPANVISIGDGAFCLCTAISSFIVADNNSVYKSIDGILFTKDGTTIVCYNLANPQTSYTIPDGVKHIRADAFAGSKALTSIKIPPSVISIGGYAFEFSDKLKSIYCYAENIPQTDASTFLNLKLDLMTLYVPASSIDYYKNTAPWSGFGTIKTIEEGDVPETKKCATPTISYNNGKLTFNCDTDGAICQSIITDPDINSYSSNEVQLGVTYTITVYATKDGYKNSEIATATLCWIDVEPKKEGITDGVANVPAQAVMIQNNGNMLTIQGAEDGTPVSVYGINGTQEGTTTISNGSATINTTLQPGSIAIVKIGQKSVKVVMN